MLDWMPIFYAGLVAFAIFMYVLLDGFDLGVGILFLFMHEEEERNIMMNTIAPVWDGNETWMVLGAALLYGMFPAVYSTLLPILYIPILILLAALIFRGVSFEFRFKARADHRWIWDVAFTAGSLVAAFGQGVVLGTFVQGFGEDAMLATVGHYAWLTPFSLMSGLGVVAGYMLLGSTWLFLKTQGALQMKAKRAASILFLVLFAFLILVSIWTPLRDPIAFDKWFSWPNMLYLAPLPMITTVAMACGWYALQKGREVLPFVLTNVVFALSFLGFVITIWPYVIPRTLTIWQAAASWQTMKFMLPGILILLPLLVGYTAYVYSIFRGKVTADVGYH